MVILTEGQHWLEYFTEAYFKCMSVFFLVAMLAYSCALCVRFINGRFIISVVCIKVTLLSVKP